MGELTEIFQWLEPGESSDVLSDPTRAPHVREELADVFAYLLRPADALCIDLEDALAEKMVVNAGRYPVRASRGRATKYSNLSQESEER